MEFAISQPKNGPIATKRKAGSNVTIGFDLGHDLDLEFSRSNIEFAISQPKMVWLPRNEEQYIDWTLGLKCDHQVYLGHDLDLEFSRSNIEFPISHPKVVWLPRNEKQTYQLNSRPQMWPMCLTLTITLNLDLWILKVKRDLDLWPHTWPWPLFSWSNFEIVESQNGRAYWRCTKGVAVGHSWPWPWVHDHLVTKVRCMETMDLPDSDQGDFSCRRAADSSSFNNDMYPSLQVSLCFFLKIFPKGSQLDNQERSTNAILQLNKKLAFISNQSFMI